MRPIEGCPGDCFRSHFGSSLFGSSFLRSGNSTGVKRQPAQRLVTAQLSVAGNRAMADVRHHALAGDATGGYARPSGYRPHQAPLQYFVIGDLGERHEGHELEAEYSLDWSMGGHVIKH